MLSSSGTEEVNANGEEVRPIRGRKPKMRHSSVKLEAQPMSSTRALPEQPFAQRAVRHRQGWVVHLILNTDSTVDLIESRASLNVCAMGCLFCKNTRAQLRPGIPEIEPPG